MKIVMIWFDERRQEICRSAEFRPGDQGRIAIPLDAHYGQAVMIVDEEAQPVTFERIVTRLAAVPTDGGLKLTGAHCASGTPVTATARTARGRWPGS